jgi:cold shock CspA family protein
VYNLFVSEPKSVQYSINTAFVGISRRAESVDRKTLVQTFVDLGPLIPVLSSKDHQVVYGRRGTGKTHALLYVTEQLKTGNAVPVYIDLRNMGSSGGIYADTQLPLTQRATRLLLDVLGAVHESLVEHAVSTDLDLATLGPILDRVAASITELEVVGEVHRESKRGTRSDHEESTADKLVEICSGLCYADSARQEGRILNFGVFKGSFGFIRATDGEEVFFHQEGMYGSQPVAGLRVNFAVHPGSPRTRAYPVLALRQ